MLDEVDAPLDDTNVNRFCEIVDEMSKKVQFIFITHNRLPWRWRNNYPVLLCRNPVSQDLSLLILMKLLNSQRHNAGSELVKWKKSGGY